MPSPALPSTPFDRREQRVIAGLARGMAFLGRLQVVSAVALLLALLTAGVVIGTAVSFDAPGSTGAADTGPLVTIGEVAPSTLAGVVALLLLVAFVFLRGGLLLVAGSEELEELLTGRARSAPFAAVLGRLRSYFVLEAALFVGLAGGGMLLLGGLR